MIKNLRILLSIILSYTAHSLTAYSMPMDKMNKIYNFYSFSERIGTAGQPKPDEFKIINDSGYTTVINLAMNGSKGFLNDEDKIVQSLGMNYVHIPVPWDKPEEKHLREFVKVMESLKGTKVFVHCMANYRVSAFMYLYLSQVRSLSKADSTSSIMAKWLPNMDENWDSFMKIKLSEGVLR